LGAKLAEKEEKTKKVGEKFQYVDKILYFCNLKCRIIKILKLRIIKNKK